MPDVPRAALQLGGTGAATWRGRAAVTCGAVSALAGVTWLASSLAGWSHRAQWGPLVVELGRSSLLRFAAWALLATVALHPRRAALVEGLSRHVEGWAGRAALAGFAVLLVAFKVTQHLGFRTAGYDLSLYHWAVHHAVRAPWLHAYGLERSYFSEHFSPVLLLLAPAEWLGGPLGLVVAQALLCALGVWLVFAAARTFDVAALPAAVLALASTASAPWWAAFDFDFHPEVLVLPFAAGFVWAVRTRRARWAVGFALLLLSVKEDAALVLLAVAAWLAWVDPPARRWCAAAAALAVVWLVLALRVFIPWAVPDGQGAWRLVADRYGDWGDSYGQIAWNVLTSPLRAATALTAALGPLLQRQAFVPVLAMPAFLASLPLAGLHALSRYAEQASLWGYYALPTLTLWVVGLTQLAGRVQRRWGASVAVALAAAPLLFTPASLRVDWPTADDGAAHRLLQAWPAGVPVAAQNALVPHLPVRPGEVLDLQHWARAQAVVLRPQANHWPLGTDEYVALVRQLLQDEGFGVDRLQPGLIVLRRGADSARADEALAQVQRDAR